MSEERLSAEVILFGQQQAIRSNSARLENVQHSRGCVFAQTAHSPPLLASLFSIHPS